MSAIKKLNKMIDETFMERLPEDSVEYQLRYVAYKPNFCYNIVAIDELHVAETHRLKGYARKAIRIINEQILEAGIEAIVITASDIYGANMDQLQKLYASIGFTQIPNGLPGAMYYLNPANDSALSKQIVRDLSLSSMRQMFE